MRDSFQSKKEKKKNLNRRGNNSSETRKPRWNRDFLFILKASFGRRTSRGRSEGMSFESASAPNYRRAVTRCRRRNLIRWGTVCIRVWRRRAEDAVARVAWVSVEAGRKLGWVSFKVRFEAGPLATPAHWHPERTKDFSLKNADSQLGPPPYLPKWKEEFGWL